MGSTTRNDRVRMAVLGYGGGGIAHATRLLRLSGVHLVKVFSHRLDRLPRTPHAEQGVAFTDRIEDILDGSVEAVTICTPDHTHFEYAARTVQAGLHTLVEKPMFLSRRACDDMEALLEGRGIVFGVHHQMRWVPTFRAAREAIRQGRLGDVLLVEADYHHHMRERAGKYDDWRFDRAHPARLVPAFMSHTFDLMEWLVDDEIEGIQAQAAHRGWAEWPDVDTVSAGVRFRSGVLGRSAVTIASRGPQRNTIAVYGTRGQIHDNLLRDEAGRIELLHMPAYPFKLGLWSRALAEMFRWRPAAHRNFPLDAYEHDIACLGLLGDFVAAVRTATPFPVGLAEGRRAVERCLECIAAYGGEAPFES